MGLCGCLQEQFFFLPPRRYQQCISRMEFPSPGPGPTSTPVSDDPDVVSETLDYIQLKGSPASIPQNVSALPCGNFSCGLPSQSLPTETFQNHPEKSEHQQHPLVNG